MPKALAKYLTYSLGILGYNMGTTLYYLKEFKIRTDLPKDTKVIVKVPSIMRDYFKKALAKNGDVQSQVLRQFIKEYSEKAGFKI